MSNILRTFRLPIAAATILLLVFTTFGVSPAFAAAPYLEGVHYLGKGKVEVEFDDDARYKNVKITVKDTSGKKYKARIYRKNEDELRFKVNNYKEGKTYKFTISGVRDEDTRSYGKVTGKFKIKKANSNTISASKAKSIAYKDAGVSSSEVLYSDVYKDRDDGRSYYDVVFETNSAWYEYEISLSGKILSKDVDRYQNSYYGDDYYSDGYYGYSDYGYSDYGYSDYY